MSCRSRKLLAVLLTGLLGCSMFESSPEVTRDLRNPGMESCPLHKIPLEEGIEKVSHNDQPLPSDYFDVRRTTFPYAMTGDLVDQDATKAQVLYCPECRLARKRWLEKQQ